MPTKDTWRLATAEDDGKPLIFRIRENAPSFAKKAAFPHLLAVSWEYEPSNDQGMPEQDDVDRMTETAARRLMRGWSLVGRIGELSAFVRRGRVVCLLDEGGSELLHAGARSRRDFQELVEELGIAIHEV